MRITILAFALCVTLSSACNDTPAAPSGSPGTTTEVCQAACGWGQRCAAADAGAVSPTCLQDCLAGAPPASIVSSAAMGLLRDCFTTLPCTTSDDECMTRVVTSNPAWQQDAVYQQCMAAHTACETSTSFSDDNCTSSFMLNDAGRQRFAACFQKACAEISACLRAAFQTP